jgi:hypothetical protein
MIKKVLLMIIAVLFVLGCEPEWKATVNAYGEKLAELEELSEAVMAADKEAIESAKTIIDDIEALEIELADVEDEKAMGELAKFAGEYMNAVELTVNIDKYEDMVIALEESVEILEKMEKDLPDILILVKGAMAGDVMSMQALQQKMPELQEMALKLQSISQRLHPDDAAEFMQKIESLKEEYPELEQLGM